MIDSLFSLPSKNMVAAGSVAKFFCKIRQHGFHHPRITARRGIIIQINRKRYHDVNRIFSIMQNYFKSFYEKVNPESLILLIMSKRNFSPDRLCNPDIVDLRYAPPCDRFTGTHCQTYCRSEERRV